MLFSISKLLRRHERSQNIMRILSIPHVRPPATFIPDSSDVGPRHCHIAQGKIAAVATI